MMFKLEKLEDYGRIVCMDIYFLEMLHNQLCFQIPNLGYAYLFVTHWKIKWFLVFETLH